MTCKWIRVKWTTQVPTEVVIVEQRIFYLTAWRLEMRTGSCAFSPMVISGWPSLVLNEPHLDQFDQNTGPFGITFKIAYVVEETVYVPYILKLKGSTTFSVLFCSQKRWLDLEIHRRDCKVVKQLVTTCLKRLRWGSRRQSVNEEERKNEKIVAHSTNHSHSYQ